MEKNYVNLNKFYDLVMLHEKQQDACFMQWAPCFSEEGS